MLMFGTFLSIIVRGFVSSLSKYIMLLSVGSKFHGLFFY